MEPDQPTTIRYENVADKLIEHVPELSEAYEAELKWWRDGRPGPHVVYGDFLNPHIDRVLQSGDEAGCRRLFAFLELLSCSEDQRVQELVAVTVCEHLGNDEKRLRQATRFMGRATRKLCDDVERFWGG